MKDKLKIKERDLKDMEEKVGFELALDGRGRYRIMRMIKIKLCIGYYLLSIVSLSTTFAIKYFQ